MVWQEGNNIYVARSTDGGNSFSKRNITGTTPCAPPHNGLISDPLFRAVDGNFYLLWREEWTGGGETNSAVKFYSSVALAGIGDINGDGISDVATGAPFYDVLPHDLSDTSNGETIIDAGRVYLYYGGQGWQGGDVIPPSRASITITGQRDRTNLTP